jgi:PKD repeat protein
VNVAFYTEASSAQGPQPTSDHLIGYGRRQGNNWVITASTANVTPGVYTVYAIATDSAGDSSSPALATITVQARPKPTIGSLQASSLSVTAGQSITFTAANVSTPGGTFASVAFYREINPSQGPQPGSDHLIGYGRQQGNNWVITASTAQTVPGTYTIYAVVTDSAGDSSSPVAITVTVLPASSANNVVRKLGVAKSLPWWWFDGD